MPIGSSDGKQYETEAEAIIAPHIGGIDEIRAPFGVMSEGEIPSGSLQGQVGAKKIENTLNTMSTPGDVLAGKIEPGSVQEMEKATQLAGLMVTGPAPVAASMADGTLGSFAGVKSKTLNRQALYDAQNMEMDNVHPDDIWSKTGFAKGIDNRWRYEIPDQSAVLLPDKFYPQDESIALPQSKSNFFGESKPNKLPEILDHPELYEAYPDLKNVKVAPMPQDIKSMGMYSTKDNTIYVSPLHPETMRSTILHEVQHIIQDKEGFSYGGSPSMFKDEGEQKAYEMYRRLAGEVEARNVQARSDYGLMRRTATPPAASEDVPRFSQIVQ